MKIVTTLYITGKGYFLKQPFLRIKTQTQFKNTNYLSITKIPYTLGRFRYN
nr:MAG TPA: hypothetical protein [Caudoviricetes sp.]